VSRALTVAAGNQSQAAKLLGISRNGLAAKIARHGLAAPKAPDDGPDDETDDPASEAHDHRT
jgi:hypothetical protein